MGYRISGELNQSLPDMEGTMNLDLTRLGRDASWLTVGLLIGGLLVILL